MHDTCVYDCICSVGSCVHPVDSACYSVLPPGAISRTMPDTLATARLSDRRMVVEGGGGGGFVQ